jgi:glutamine amidotransferase
MRSPTPYLPAAAEDPDMRIAVFDFGVGNLHSLTKALARHAGTVDIVTDTGTIDGADAIVLPGVGAFGAAASALDRHRDRIAERLRAGMPCLGICLGMQLLFDASEEGGGRGIGAIAGSVRKLRSPRIPHMGWNAVSANDDPLFDGIDGLVAWYANSFVVRPDDETNVIAWSEYGGDRFPAAVRSGNTLGVQFHPEKSGADGLRLIDNFLERIA